MLTGENGILLQAQRAKEETENAAREEERILSEIESEMTGEVTKVVDTTPGELDGEGTEEKPFKIESVENLVKFLNSINSGEEYSGKVIELVYTLDIASTKSYADANSTMFGDYNGDDKTEGIFDEINNKDYSGLILTNETFSGTLDGNGKEIRNIYTTFHDQTFKMGLIGINNGTVKDINISGEYNVSEMYEYYRIGGIAGENNGNIENCTSKIVMNVNLSDNQKIEEKSMYLRRNSRRK